MWTYDLVETLFVRHRKFNVGKSILDMPKLMPVQENQAKTLRYLRRLASTTPHRFSWILVCMDLEQLRTYGSWER